MAKKGTNLHFDTSNMRTIFWKDPDCPEGLDELRVGAEVRKPTHHTLTGWRYPGPFQ